MKKLLINGKPKTPKLPEMNFHLEHSNRGDNPSVILMATNEHGTCRGILEISTSCQVSDAGYLKEMDFTVHDNLKK